jgi:hypothetical protein
VGVILGFEDLDENPIDEFNTTLELEHVHTKGGPFLTNRSLYIITMALQM